MKYLIGIECAYSMRQILSFENCLISSLGVVFIKYCYYTDPQLGLCKCFKEFLSNEICPFGDQIRMETTASANSSFLLQKKKKYLVSFLLPYSFHNAFDLFVLFVSRAYFSFMSCK